MNNQELIDRVNSDLNKLKSQKCWKELEKLQSILDDILERSPKVPVIDEVYVG